MSGTTIRVADLPDLGTVTDASSIVADKAAGTGRFSALAIKSYCAVTTLPEAPSNNTPYGRMNGAWTPVLGDAPSNGSSYARLNATWTPVVPEAPLTGSTYGRVNGAWTPVLPITGGSINGNLSASGNITSGQGVYANQFALSSAGGYEWQFYLQAGTGNHIQSHRANWFEMWDSSNGTRSWQSPAGTSMQLDGAGNLTVAGNIAGSGAASSISVPGNITGGTAVWNAPGSFGFAPGGQGRIFYFGAQYYWEWNTSNGQLTWISNGTPMWNMRASDGLTFNSVAPVGGVGPYLNVSDRRTKAGITPSTKGLAEVLQLQPVSFTRDYPGVPAGAPEEIGFIAQDVQPIVPEAVWGAGIVPLHSTPEENAADPTLAISESTLTALNVNAIKELNDMIASLTTRVAALEAP